MAPNSPDKSKRHSRRSLSGLFEDVHIEHPSRDTSPSKATGGLRGTFSRGWPSWTTISRGNKPSLRIFFTLKLDTITRYSKYISNELKDEQPEGNMEIAKQLMHDIDEMLQANTGGLEGILENAILTAMAHAIFGSNRIEKAGTNLMETVRLCLLVFARRELGAYEERSEGYQEKLERFIAKDSGSTAGDEWETIRTRRERDEPFTEELILKTHGILCDKIESASGHSSAKYAGMYRTKDAFAGTTRFTKPSEIRTAMASMVKKLKKDMAEGEEGQVLDPFMMAAKYCDRFVNIHPFADGNGRMCRLILNTILLKYAGIVVPIGEHDTDRDEYLHVASRSGQAGGHPGELGNMILEKGLSTFRRLTNTLKDALKTLK